MRSLGLGGAPGGASCGASVASIGRLSQPPDRATLERRFDRCFEQRSRILLKRAIKNPLRREEGASRLLFSSFRLTAGWNWHLPSNDGGCRRVIGPVPRLLWIRRSEHYIVDYVYRLSRRWVTCVEHTIEVSSNQSQIGAISGHEYGTARDC